MSALVAAAAAVFATVVVSAAGPATNLDVIAYTQRTVTIQWSPSAGATGYRLYKDGSAVSTAGASATKAKFGSLSWAPHTLGVEPLPDGGVSTISVVGQWVETGSTEPAPPPPPPPPTDPPPPPPTSGDVATANLWMDENGGTCTRQSTAGAYVDAQACPTLQAAMAASNGGDTVGMRCVSASSCIYTGSGSVTATRTTAVTFRLSNGATVAMAGLGCSTTCQGVHLIGDPGDWFRLSVDGVYSGNGTPGSGGADFKLQYADFPNDATFYFSDGTDRATIDSVDIGPASDNNDRNRINTHSNTEYNTNIAITNNLFHDLTHGGDAGAHHEAIWMAAVDGMTISGNRFKRIYGNTAILFFTTTNGSWCPGERNMTVTGNYFGATSYGGSDGAIDFGYDQGCGTARQDITFDGNCWESSVKYGTLVDTPVNVGHGPNEYGNLDGNNHDWAVSKGVTFAAWPFLPLASCPLESSG